MQATLMDTGEQVEVPMGHRQLASMQWSAVHNWSNPAPYQPERCKMLMGEIDTFYEERGYGFLESQEGRIFFHVSGFRQPRLFENPKYSPPRPEIQLVDLHEKLPAEKKKRGLKPELIPVPHLPKSTVVLFELGKRQGKELACIWCLRDVYVPLQHELELKYEEAIIKWQRDAIFKLTLHTRKYGQFRADNALKKMVRDSEVQVTRLFEGTNTTFLQAWFRDCRDSFQLSADCWMELTYREWDESHNQHGPWQRCPDEMMHDFLG